MKTKKIAPKKAVASKKVAVKKQIVSKAITTTKVNHIIPKALGMEMITRFKKSMKNLSKAKFEIGKEFNKSLFEALLKLKGIQSVRICNALNADNSHTFVIIGLDANSNELYFKIKQQVEPVQQSAMKMAILPTNDEGVGNMGTQCTEPPSKILSGSYRSI
jgi:hypothetical protein